MRRLLVLVALAAVLVLPAAASAEPAPFGHACTAQNGTRFCATTDLAGRVKSFDGVPLDVDVTLPPTGDGPFPTIAMLHGYGGSKTSFETTSPDPASTLYHYNNVHFAQQGYAVVNYTARGFGNSCGKSNPATDGCEKGWSHLADQRYEVRDTQYLLGLLADAGIAKAGALGVTGISYGGGQSQQLALLRDRIRNTDGSLAPWTTAKGTALSITAAYPKWGWSDFSRALMPNGRWLDFRIGAVSLSSNPIGVQLQSYVNGLYFIRGTDPPAGTTDPTADLKTWKAASDKGEPYGAAAGAALTELTTYHSADGLLAAAAPGFTAAPLLLENGWTDDLFPVQEALDLYNRLRALDAGANVALQLGDLGHSRGSNKIGVDKALNDEGARFFASWLKSEGTRLPGSQATAYTQTCPKAAPAKGYTAAKFTKLHPGAIRFGTDKAQTVSSKGGDFKTQNDLDPVRTNDACTQFAVAPSSAVADYGIDVERAFTLLGLPTVQAKIQTTGRGGQIDARLWDISSNAKKQTLVTRGVYRLADNQKGTITFQLHGNGYRFAKGHIARLELLGRDAPTYRASNTKFSVKISKLTVELPTHEKPSRKTGIVAPKLGR